MVVKYKGQKLRYVKDFHGKEVLWILSPEQIEMPGMIFVGGYPMSIVFLWIHWVMMNKRKYENSWTKFKFVGNRNFEFGGKKHDKAR